jgi:hypothetical protein
MVERNVTPQKACEFLKGRTVGWKLPYVHTICDELNAHDHFLVDMISFLDHNGHSHTKMRYKVDLLLNKNFSIAEMRERVAEIEKIPLPTARREGARD